MKTPVVTVFMPAYNAARFIATAIQSVLAQTFPDFELLIIDDGSTDNTIIEIARFADTRIRVFHNSENAGLVTTLNQGINEARGKYIARLDADDVCYPDRLEKQVNTLERDPDAGVASGWTEIIDANDRTTSFGNWRLSPEAIYYVLHFRQCLTHSSVMFRTSLGRKLEGYSAEAVKAEDFDLWHRISRVSKIVQLSSLLVKWRQHQTSITGAGIQEMERTAFRLAEKYIREVTGEPWPSQVVKAFVECRNVARLDPDLLAAFPAQLKKLQDNIIRAAPEIYDKRVLRAYADVEAAKYVYILRSLGKPSGLDVSCRAKFLGFAYYLSCYHHLPLMGTVVPKSHF